VVVFLLLTTTCGTDPTLTDEEQVILETEFKKPSVVGTTAEAVSEVVDAVSEVIAFSRQIQESRLSKPLTQSSLYKTDEGTFPDDFTKPMLSRACDDANGEKKDRDSDSDSETTTLTNCVKKDVTVKHGNKIKKVRVVHNGTIKLSRDKDAKTFTIISDAVDPTGAGLVYSEIAEDGKVLRQSTKKTKSVFSDVVTRICSPPIGPQKEVYDSYKVQQTGIKKSEIDLDEDGKKDIIRTRTVDLILGIKNTDFVDCIPRGQGVTLNGKLELADSLHEGQNLTRQYNNFIITNKTTDLGRVVTLKGAVMVSSPCTGAKDVVMNVDTITALLIPEDGCPVEGRLTVAVPDKRGPASAEGAMMFNADGNVSVSEPAGKMTSYRSCLEANTCIKP